MSLDAISAWALRIQEILNYPNGCEADFDEMKTLIAKIVEAC